MSEQSIYAILCESLVDGRLPCDFELPHIEVAPSELKFMVGAKDGIGVFHTAKNEPKKAVKKILRLLKSRKTDKITPIIKENGVFRIIDPLLAAIEKEKDNLEPYAVFSYANSLAFESSDEDMVKLGIAMLGLFDWNDIPDMQEKLVTLGLYEEFTLYVVVNVQGYENGNDVIFRIAQNVDGWGKIHAVERLEAQTDEIQEWILRYGCENDVMDAYLGLECAEKGNLIDALRRESLDSDLYDSIGIIIDALLDEGPVDGISVYVHAEEALLRYLQFAEKYAASLKHLWRILNVQDFLYDIDDDYGFIPENKDALLKLCSNIVTRTAWRELITATLADSDNNEFFYASDAANRLNMDVTDLIYAAVKKAPVKNSGYISHVYKNPKYAQKLTALYESILPLDRMATGMGDYLFADSFRQEHSALESVLQELQQYPNMGELLIMAALGSPVVRERNFACRALEKWCSLPDKPISSFSPGLYEKLQSTADIEISPDTKKTMIELLKHETHKREKEN